MTEQGYIKLYRSILNWEWWSDDKTMRVFLWLLLNANWEDSRFKGYEVPKGSLVVGRNKMAKELKLSEQEIRTTLVHLKSTNEITIKSTNKFSIISIVNWEKYQGCDLESTNKTTNNPTNNQPTTNHIKEYKEYKEYKKSISGNDLYKMSMSGNYDFDELERETRNGN